MSTSIMSMTNECKLNGITKRYRTIVLACWLHEWAKRYVSVSVGFNEIHDRHSFRNQLFNILFIFKLNIFGVVTNISYITLLGITYVGTDEQGKQDWSGCSNIKLIVFENATRFQHYIDSFNVQTNHWVAEYIYKRLKFLGSRLYSQIGTLVFLAIWHGLHSGYYMCFLMEFMVMLCEREVSWPPGIHSYQFLSSTFLFPGRTRIQAQRGIPKVCVHLIW